MNHAEAVITLATAPGWQTSTRTSQGQNCVEVITAVRGWVGVRDTKNRAAGLLAIDQQQWNNVLDAITAGQFDL
ncbi:MAG: DUF397 domain-containing protein [Pseudonocardiaceae bacterium]